LFIKTQIDPAGGSNFTIETQTQLLTVPYSMAAKTAETAVTVQGLENLIERVNNLENQIEELWTYTYEEGALNSTHWKAAGIVNSETGNFYEFEPKDCESCYKLSFGECTFSGPVDNIIGGFGYGNILCGFYDINYITKNIYINIWTATLVGQHFDEELYIETLNSVYYFSLRGSKLLLYFDEHKYLLLNLLVL